MTIEIVDNRIKGYITPNEYAKKYHLKIEVVRSWLFYDKIHYIQIMDRRFIPEDEPIPYLNNTGVKREPMQWPEAKKDQGPRVYLSLSEFAKNIGVQYATAYKWAQRNLIPYEKNGTHIYVRADILPPVTRMNKYLLKTLGVS